MDKRYIIRRLWIRNKTDISWDNCQEFNEVVYHNTKIEKKGKKEKRRQYEAWHCTRMSFST